MTYFEAQQARATLRSRTFWGVMIAAAAALLQLFGVVELDAADQQALLDRIMNAVELAGLALALYGRARAKGPLTLRASALLPLALLALLAGGLGGCSLAPGGEKVQAAIDSAVATGLEDRRAYNDRKAETLLVLPCDISIGAYYRIDNAVKQKALQELCSGREIGQPGADLGVGVTVE